MSAPCSICGMPILLALPDADVCCAACQRLNFTPPAPRGPVPLWATLHEVVAVRERQRREEEVRRAVQ